MYDDNSNNKCDSTLTKRYKYDGLMVAVIGLSIVASLICFTYLSTHLLEKHQTPRVTV